ncbi:MAG: hypothetical protein IKX14_03355 [Neisseriaceae bacterium]|nr:hypothetical protein [Neisseriaceae bacterium]
MQNTKATQCVAFFVLDYFVETPAKPNFLKRNAVGWACQPTKPPNRAE